MGAKIRNRYNQVPHLTQDTNVKVTNSQLDTTNESQEVSPFPAGDHKAHINRCAQRHSKHKTEQKHKRSTKEVYFPFLAIMKAVRRKQFPLLHNILFILCNGGAGFVAVSVVNVMDKESVKTSYQRKMPIQKSFRNKRLIPIKGVRGGLRREMYKI